MPWKRIGNCVHKLDADGEPLADEKQCFDDAEAAEAHLRALYANVDEAVTDEEAPVMEQAADAAAPTEDVPPTAPVMEMRETAVVSLRNEKPVVEIFPDVDIAALTAGDSSPVFLTLPIAEVGRVGRGLYRVNGKTVPIEYDEQLVADIERQVREKRPGGVMGHPDKDQRDRVFPISQVLWVGAQRHGNTLFGKAYVRDQAVAELVRDLSAVNGRIGISILGESVFEAGETTARLRHLKLERIDLADPDRASVDLGGAFVLTAEMAGSTFSDMEKDTMERTELANALKELSAGDLLALLGDKAKGVAEMYAQENKSRLVAANVAEMATGAELTIRELSNTKETQAQQIAELNARVAAYEQREFQSSLTALVAESINWDTNGDADADKRVNALRRNLERAVVDELDGAQDLRKAKVAINELMSGDFGQIAEAVRESLAGPSAVVNGKGKTTNEDLLNASREALRKLGAN